MSNKHAAFLVVDDEPEICWIFERIINKSGAVCHTARNAKEAKALANLQPYSIAFLDAKLPDSDGLDLANWLINFLPGIHIVIVSGYFYQDDPIITAAVRLGRISAFIAKPFNHAEILRTIESLCPSTERGKKPPVK